MNMEKQRERETERERKKDIEGVSYVEKVCVTVCNAILSSSCRSIIESA